MKTLLVLVFIMRKITNNTVYIVQNLHTFEFKIPL